MPVKKSTISKTVELTNESNVGKAVESAVEVAVVESTPIEQVAGGDKKKRAPKKNTEAKKVVNKEEAVVEVKADVVATVVDAAEPVKNVKKTNVKKVNKKQKKNAEVVGGGVVVEGVEGEANVVEDDFKTRSFKVQLPGNEEFTGRFTGLTPYQAANKALSKFFRNNENKDLTEKNQIVFSIKESSRGSKRQTYSYKGSRLKLEVPISYTIKSLTGEERVIVKQYKNQLIKVKKNVTVKAESILA